MITINRKNQLANENLNVESLDLSDKIYLFAWSNVIKANLLHDISSHRSDFVHNRYFVLGHSLDLLNASYSHSLSSLPSTALSCAPTNLLSLIHDLNQFNFYSKYNVDLEGTSHSLLLDVLGIPVSKIYY